MGINRKTVAKYRILRPTQEQACDVLSGKEEQMLFKQKVKELMPPPKKLTKQEKAKLSLLEHYTDKDIKEMLDYIARTKKEEIDEVL